MPVRFRKSKTIMPGVRVTAGKKSVSVSAGGKGVRQSVSTSGRKTTTVGVPGSGVRHETTNKAGCLGVIVLLVAVWWMRR